MDGSIFGDVMEYLLEVAVPLKSVVKATAQTGVGSLALTLVLPLRTAAMTTEVSSSSSNNIGSIGGKGRDEG